MKIALKSKTKTDCSTAAAGLPGPAHRHLRRLFPDRSHRHVFSPGDRWQGASSDPQVSQISTSRTARNGDYLFIFCPSFSNILLLGMCFFL